MNIFSIFNGINRCRYSHKIRSNFEYLYSYVYVYTIEKDLYILRDDYSAFRFVISHHATINK